MLESQTPQYQGNGKWKKSLIYFGSIIIIALLVMALVLWIMSRRTSSENVDQTETPITEEEKFMNEVKKVEEAFYAKQKELGDSDGDRLSDEEEIQLGTDPNNEDSDGDNLSDFREVKEFGTDPLNADTDGDGITDWNEDLKPI